MATSMRHVKRKERLKMRNKLKRDVKKQHDFLGDGAWRPYEVEMSVFADEEMGGFVGMEVLTDYDPKLLQKYTGGTTVQQQQKPVSDSAIRSKTSRGKERKTAKQKPKMKLQKQNDGNTPSTKQSHEQQKRRKSVENRTEVATSPVKTKTEKIVDDGRTRKKIDHSGEDGEKGRRRKRKSGREHVEELMKRRRKRRRVSEQGEDEEREGGAERDAASSPGQEAGEDLPGSSAEVSMSPWGSLSIPTPVHTALQAMGYAHPTPIQAACIPAAITQGRDVVGAAETGSGKTLAFGIPLIYRVLKNRVERAQGKHSTTVPESTASEASTVPQERVSNEVTLDGMKSADEKYEGKKEEEEGEGLRILEDGVPASARSDEMIDMASSDHDDDDSDDDESDEADSDYMYDSDEEDEDGDEDDNERGRDFKEVQAKLRCVEVVENISDQDWQSAGLPLARTPAGGRGQGGSLFGLVLTPTRELAVQVKNHLVAAAKMTDIKVAVVVGGMSSEKQKRVLRRRPDIIVGTPGRLWELFKLGEPHLSSLPDVQCLVIDEADRMVERGHYAELSEILDLLNSSERQSSRQVFVFSATLSLIHMGPLRRSLKKAFKLDRKEKLDSVMAKVGVKDSALVVDLTKREGTAATLLESKIVCEVEEKDIYLFYFLRQYPGRTLVFTNSIDCIRRLVAILSLLDRQPLPLHSAMHQKQRLKNLERFTSNPQGLLLATDVAARGLDIPDIEHVIHYQVPRTAESYVHRSGRTARQAKTGLSVTFISSSEINFYRRLCKTLNREELPSFPIEHSYYRAIRERVDLARDIDKMQHQQDKKRHHNEWFLRAARELDVDLDADRNLHDMGDSAKQKQFAKKINVMKALLKALLKKKIFASGSSQLYLTSGGKLVSPFSPASAGAQQAVSRLQERMRKDRTEDRMQKDRKRKRFKRMGRYHTTA